VRLLVFVERSSSFLADHTSGRDTVSRPSVAVCKRYVLWL